jgi:hypothetical protein
MKKRIIGRPTLSRALTIAALVFAGCGFARAEERSILTPDGTIYHVQSGRYSTFEPTGTAADPDDFVIRWDSRSQDGQTLSGIIPDTNSPEIKNEFDLAYDSYSQSLILVWNNRFSLINSIQFAVLQSGIWTRADLLPTNVFTFASNPSILITHQTVQTLDADGKEIDMPRSIASIVWWEGSVRPHARFAPIFIEKGGIDTSSIEIYDLPELTGSSSILMPGILDNPLFAQPLLQADGLLSGIIATFADVATNSLRVTRIDFPSDFRSQIDPQHGRHVIVILGTQSAPLPSMIPTTAIRVGTVVGGGYQPTVYWQTDGSSVNYVMFNGLAWGQPHLVALTPTLTVDTAVSLIDGMAVRN